MHNSTLPATGALSHAFAELADDGFKFQNFDVIADERL